MKKSTKRIFVLLVLLLAGFLAYLFLEASPPRKIQEASIPKDRCLVTGVSSNHYAEGLCLLLGASKYGFSRTVVVDMGLSERERREVGGIAHTTLVTVEMPEHAKLFLGNNKGFKPIALQWLSLMNVFSDCEEVVWADSSIRFRKNISSRLFATSGLALVHATAGEKAPNAEWTDPGMYSWFGLDRRNDTSLQYQSGSIFFNPRSKVWSSVLSSWSLCAQTQRCIMPPGASLQVNRNRVVDGVRYWAHRDDQSALNLAILSLYGKLFHASLLLDPAPFAVFRDQTCQIKKQIQKNDLPSQKFVRQVVVLSLNENPFYSFFGPIAVMGWVNLGFHPIVFVTPGVPDSVIEAISCAGGGVFVITDKWKHDPQRVQLMQSVRLLGALLPGVPSDATVTTADIDIFPLNRDVFNPSKYVKDEFHVQGNHPATVQYQEYPISYLTATTSLWKKVLGFSQFRPALEALETATNKKRDWNFDQVFVFSKVQQSKVQTRLHPWNDNLRIDFRTNPNAQFFTGAVDCHLLRPAFIPKNWGNLRERFLKHVLNQRQMQEIDEFHKKFMLERPNLHDLRDGRGRRE
jgi:hypothetical protein